MKALLADERVRFLIAGGAAAFLNWIVRFPLSMFLPYAAAVSVAMGIGMVVGFILYRNLVFQTATRPLWLQIRDFIGVNLVAAVVTVLVAVGLSKGAWWPEASLRYVPGFSHLVGIGIGAVVNFFGHKIFTFR